MSVYSQSYYGQPSYSGPNFAPPPVHNGFQYSYQQHPSVQAPPPPVFHHVDPTTFRRDYTQRLSQLTFNSRPIIQSLSMLAQDYSRYGDIVAQCIETHIRQVPPWMKLPGFYLLDAISKNVYEPYARHFASFVIPLFIETYNVVDDNTRGKMEEMLLTWRTGSPHGKELFGVPPQIAIERGVWGGDAADQNRDGLRGTSQITKSQVLSELQFTLGQKERALQINPYDTASQNHVTVLHQLRKLIEAGVSQEELQQILAQLRTLVRPAPPPPPPPPSLLPLPSTQWQSPAPFTTQSQVNQVHTPQSFNPPPRHYPQQDSVPFGGFVKTEGASSSVATTSSAHSVLSPQSGNIANLLSTLIKAGVVSATGTPTGAGATAKDEEFKPSMAEGNVDMDRKALREYRNAVLAYPVKLTSSDILRSRPRIVEFLYDRLNTQCKQCGIRFDDSAIGKRSMEDHLDMHFRQNRKANQNIGRGHSRSWFVGLEDWINEVSADVKGKGRADAPRRMNAKAAAAEEVAKRDAELRAQFVVVPPGDEAKPISCPICKETLKSEFLEDDEDWVWKNAVMKDDRVFHATCHAEAVVSTNSLAARLRTEAANRSRSGTPETQLLGCLRSTPPAAVLLKTHTPSPPPTPESKLAGTKRKVDDEPKELEEVNGTPPFKKQAFSICVDDAAFE